MHPLTALAVLATEFDPGPEFDRNVAPFAALMFIGFVVGVFGHIIKSNATIATGIAMVFLGTVVLPLVVHLL